MTKVVGTEQNEKRYFWRVTCFCSVYMLLHIFLFKEEAKVVGDMQVTGRA